MQRQVQKNSRSSLILIVQNYRRGAKCSYTFQKYSKRNKLQVASKCTSVPQKSGFGFVQF